MRSTPGCSIVTFRVCLFTLLSMCNHVVVKHAESQLNCDRSALSVGNTVGRVRLALICKASIIALPALAQYCERKKP